MNKNIKRSSEVFNYYRKQTGCVLLGNTVPPENKTITQASFLQQRRDDLSAICGNIAGIFDALSDIGFRKQLIGL